MNKFLTIILFVYCSQAVGRSNTNDTLYLKDYLDQLYQNYPLIKKANLYNEVSAAYALQGRGVVDPQIGSSYQAKDFKNTNYFTIWRSEAQIPTRLPIHFSIGYENNDGDFLNPENNVPDRGLMYGTVNLSIVRGFLFNEQRYILKSAELNQLKGQIDRDVLKREVVYQSILAYLDWSDVFYNNQIYEEYKEVIVERHNGIKQLFVNGDRPAIDTVESRMNLNNADKLVLESRARLEMNRQRLNLFLWDEQGNPLTINVNIAPEYIEKCISGVEELMPNFSPNVNDDPMIRKIKNQREQLVVENRWEKENLKPQLDLKYNTILNLGQTAGTENFSFNDYKYGLKLEVPIINRSVRGKINLNSARIDQLELDLIYKEQSLQMRMQILIANRTIYENVIAAIDEKRLNSRTLYNAEKLKFGLGESSVFLLNNRERKVLESDLEFVSSYTDLAKIVLELYYLQFR